jgi:hypothetical protein
MHPDDGRRRAIAVFAHNESRRIISCLESLRLSPLPPGTICYVIANGCTDDTFSRVRHYASTADWVKVIELEIGDKSNAWNHFVHEMNIVADTYFFTDGDCNVDPGALQNLEKALLSDTAVNASSGVPAQLNRSLGLFRAGIMDHGGLAGNLYALSGSFVDRVRAMNIRLPRGLVGDDSFVGALALWNLDPNGTWDRSRLKVVESATFRYESIVQASFNDPMFYIRRLRRYSLRHFQNQLIRNRIKVIGPANFPDHIDKLYLDAKELELVPRRSLGYYFFDCWAIQTISKAQAEVRGKA